MSPESSESRSSASSSIQNPPTTAGGILRNLGPGLIVAGSIVGSGELIATTKTGAEAGFALLWLIIIGCVIKVFAQIEFGRFSINTGRTTLDGLNQVPGPRLRVNWIVWYWLVMMMAIIGQQGGIVGGVGQAMALSVPLSGDFKDLIAKQQAWDDEAQPIRARLVTKYADDLKSKKLKTKEAALDRVKTELGAAMAAARPSQSTRRTRDDVYWAAIITAVTVAILVVGRYRLIQSFCTAMVASFTFVTVANVVALQTEGRFAVSWEELKLGLSFGLPEPILGTGTTPIITALATFGIIGVGASELIVYPYWCVEKGYARFAGPRDDSEGWGDRARGWLRVMRWDAWTSMVVYTFATVAFYLLGAAVLHREGLNPEKDQLVPTLAQMYYPVFGAAAQMVFLFGAIAVLYSTFFAAAAGNARIAADAIRVFRIGAADEPQRRWWVVFFCVFYPVVALSIYWYNPTPAKLVLLSGLAQVVMLPMLAGAALFFRYRRIDLRTAPGKLWDILLWVSAFGMILAGTFGALTKLFPQLKLLG